MGQIEVCLLLEEGIVGASESRDRLNVEKEVSVDA